MTNLRPKTLTDVQIRKLNLEKGEQHILRDARTPGLALRACGPIRRTWYLFHRVNGKQKRIKLGVYPTMSIADARRAALNTIHAPQDRRELTFGELCQKFLDEYAYPRLRGAEEIEGTFRRHVLPSWEHRKVSEITKADARERLAGIEKPGAARGVRSWTTRVFNWAIEQDLAERNPFDKLRDLVPAPKRERVLTDDELKAVWQAAGSLNYPYGPLIQCLILTGARRGELMNARWDWLDGDTIEVPASEYKTKKAHLIVLSPLARDIIHGIPPEEFIPFCEHEYWDPDPGLLERLAHTTERMAEYYGLPRNVFTQRSSRVDELALKHGIEKHAGKLDRLINRLADLLHAETYNYTQTKTKDAEAAVKLVDRLIKRNVATPGEREMLQFMLDRLEIVRTTRKNPKPFDYYRRASSIRCEKTIVSQ